MHFNSQVQRQYQILLQDGKDSGLANAIKNMNNDANKKI